MGIITETLLLLWQRWTLADKQIYQWLWCIYAEKRSYFSERWWDL